MGGGLGATPLYASHMKKRSYILSLIFLILLLTNGCGATECFLIIYDTTEDELVRELNEYQLPIETIQDINTRESFNKLVSENAKEVILNLINNAEVHCDSIKLTNDSLICNSNNRIILFAINDINQIEVFYENRKLSLLKNSAIIGALTSSLATIGYLPPNPPEPTWESFAILGGVGFISGIIFDVESSTYYCLTTKESFFNFVKHNKTLNKQNGI